MLSFLRREGVTEDIVAGIEAFRAEHGSVRSGAQAPPKPRYEYYGKEEGLGGRGDGALRGENLLLVGPKATAKRSG